MALPVQTSPFGTNPGDPVDRSESPISPAARLERSQNLHLPQKKISVNRDASPDIPLVVFSYDGLPSCIPASQGGHGQWEVAAWFRDT